MKMQARCLQRSSSDVIPRPASTVQQCGISPQISVASITRSRSRATTADYEQKKDSVAHWLNGLHSFEIGQVLEPLIQRCGLNQLHFLWTALESVYHHDFLAHLKNKFPYKDFPSLSTPVSRQLKDKFVKSRRIENKQLYRAHSALINTNTSCQTPTLQISVNPSTASTPLPQLRPSTAPETVTRPLLSSLDNNVRMLTPIRRHMTVTCSATPSMRPSFICTNLTQGRRRRHSTKHHFESESISTFLLWYNSLTEESQKHDILQLIVSCLNGRELYYLAILLLSRQYRDFIGDLPEVVSLKILSLITGKDLMKFCAVSQKWYQRCSNEKLWKMKCSQTSIGVPIQGISSWKKVFINNVKMKRNWRAGNASVMTLDSHSHRVLCTRIDEMGGICASAGTDKTIKIWSLQDNTLLNTIQNCNLKNIWCVIFYGTNFIITGSGDSSIRIWNYRTGNCERCLQGHTGTVWAVRQKGDYLISGSHDKTAVLWNIRQCKYITHLIGHSGDVFAVDINDTLTIALTGSGDKTVRMWNVSDGLCFKVVSTNIHQPVISLHSSKDYCVYCNGSVITLISLSSGCLIKTFRGHQDRVECVHMNIDGCNYDTIISGSRDHTIKYWNINSGRCIRTLSGHKGPVNDIHRGNTCIISASDDHTVKIWNFYLK